MASIAEVVTRYQAAQDSYEKPPPAPAAPPTPVGPAAVKSEYVRAEWQYALVAEKIVIPILRVGEFSLLPPELAQLHCPDVRGRRKLDAIRAEILFQLRAPPPSIGRLAGVPEAP